MVMISQPAINLPGLPDLAGAPNAVADCADYSKHNKVAMNRRAGAMLA